MNTFCLSAALAAIVLAGGGAHAQPSEDTAAAKALADNTAGTPLTPSQAPGVWTLERNGRALCHITLSARVTAQGVYGAQAGPDCQGVLAAQPTAWQATAHGVRLVGPDGGAVLTLSRWSDSLFVSNAPGSASLQLRRGG